LILRTRTFDIENNKIEVHKKLAEPWKVTLIDTGLDTMTGGRLKKVQRYVENETFCFTYGDGISDINISNLLNFHKDKKRLATVTAVQPPGRFGNLEIGGDQVKKFKEKPEGDGYWINGGFFVLEPGVFDYIDDDMTIWENEPMENLSKNSQLNAFQHKGFWHAMDTLRDKKKLDTLWLDENAPWKVW